MEEQKFNPSSDDVFDQIQSLAGQFGSKISILEEQIDVHLQMQYFKLSKAVKKNLDPDSVLIQAPDLENPDLELENKKIILARLASIDKVEAFRVLENCVKNADPNLRPWAVLALQESRMLLESTLLEENQVFISTGLGGRGNKLRYFIVLVSNLTEPLSAYQEKIVNNEFELALKKHQGELETMNFSDKFVSITALIPIDIPIQGLLKGIVEECNQFGGFLKQNFLITNVKTLNSKEIDNFINQKKQFTPEPPAED